MPPIPRTKSLYELPKRDSQDYRFRNTVSFWIAVSFVEGSLLFICGALASTLELKEAWKQRGLIEFTYFAGSIFYTFGSYLGFFQVINLGRDRIRLFACSGTSREAYWGSLLYLVGALFFNVGCVEGLLPAAVQTPRLFWGLYYTPFVAGALCFVLGALIECKHNAHVRCSTPVFWLCFWYLLGSLLFLLAAVCGWPHQARENGLVNVPYAAGSLAFALGAWCALWMWKAEQFGLGFIREINEVHLNEVPAAHSSDQSPYDAYELRAASVRAANLRATSYESALASRSLASEPSASATIEAEAYTPYMEAADDDGGGGGGGGGDCSLDDGGGGGRGGGGGGPSKSVTPGWNAGKVDLAQQAFLLVYVLLGTLSVLDICNGVAYNLHMEHESQRQMRHDTQWRPVLGCERVLSSICDFFAAHGILVLATIVHRTPSLHPYDYLLWFMRFVALLYLAAEVLRFVAYARVYPTAAGDFPPSLGLDLPAAPPPAPHADASTRDASARP